MKCVGGCLKIVKASYYCEEKTEDNPQHRHQAMEICEDKEECTISASREIFGQSTCAGTPDNDMNVYIGYRCDGGKDSTILTRPPGCNLRTTAVATTTTVPSTTSSTTILTTRTSTTIRGTKTNSIKLQEIWLKSSASHCSGALPSPARWMEWRLSSEARISLSSEAQPRTRVKFWLRTRVATPSIGQVKGVPFLLIQRC